MVVALKRHSLAAIRVLAARICDQDLTRDR
jgi:hypothetical protein